MKSQAKGICRLGIVPVRAGSNDQAEMVSQLLFGDHYSLGYSPILTRVTSRRAFVQPPPICPKYYLDLRSKTVILLTFSCGM